MQITGKDGLRNGSAWVGAVVAVTLVVANCSTSFDAPQTIMMMMRLEVGSAVKVTIFRVETTTTLGPPVDE